MVEGCGGKDMLGKEEGVRDWKYGGKLGGGVRVVR